MNTLLSKLHIRNFRNFKSNIFEFGPNLTLILGENAKGKTSLLEAVYTSIYGKGFRESKENELIHWGCDNGIVDGEFIELESSNRFQIQLLRTREGRVEKKYFINKALKPASQFLRSQVHAVLFAPEQMRIITGSPSRKRKYFDSVISSTDLTYKKSLRIYENALRRRNKVLEQFENMSNIRKELYYWNDLIIENGSELIVKRQQYIEFLNNNSKVDGKDFHIKYFPNKISNDILESVYDKELRFRKTLVGPQKDDFEFYLGSGVKKNIGFFGSRSEQRLTVFWLKLRELKFFEDKSKKKPILLLDDIFSELDEHNRELVMKMIKDYQTIVTTTEENFVDLAQVPEIIIRL